MFIKQEAGEDGCQANVDQNQREWRRQRKRRDMCIYVCVHVCVCACVPVWHKRRPMHLFTLTAFPFSLVIVNVVSLMVRCWHVLSTTLQPVFPWLFNGISYVQMQMHASHNGCFLMNRGFVLGVRVFLDNHQLVNWMLSF